MCGCRPGGAHRAPLGGRGRRRRGDAPDSPASPGLLHLLAFWLLSDYLPEAARVDAALAERIRVLPGLLPGAEVRPVPVPHDCTDGFAAAYWRRPEAYLDPAVRAGISVLATVGEEALRPGLSRLADDLRTGRWHAEHDDLLGLDSLDVGYRLVLADP